jgi:hypothetical protein
MDSLNHILGLLSSLDGHGFTLLTSLSFNKPSRVKDFWIFTGLSDDHTPPSTPTTLTPEQKKDWPPYTHSIIPGPSPLSAGAEKRSPPPARVVSSAVVTNVTSSPNGHARSASDKTTAMSLSPKGNSSPFGTAPTTLLRKPSPRVKVPNAFPPVKLDRSSSSGPRLSRSGTPTADPSGRRSSLAPQQLMRSLSNPSSIGSVDMTGVGRRSMSFSRSPDVFYATDGRGKATPGQEYNPFNASLKPHVQPPHAAFIKVTTPTSDRRASMDSKSPHTLENTSSGRPTIRRSSTIPLTLDGRQDSTSSAAALQSPPPINVNASMNSDRTMNKDNEQARSKRPKEPPEALRLGEQRRTPTPPLLTPGTFRDSAFSWATGKTQDVHIAWTGHDTDPSQVLGIDRSV